MTQINHFILVFDHAQDKLIDVQDFGTDSTAAIERYGELEREHRDSVRMDIVLVGSDSLDTVRVTHATYFDGVAKSMIRKALNYA